MMMPIFVFEPETQLGFDDMPKARPGRRRRRTRRRKNRGAILLTNIREKNGDWGKTRFRPFGMDLPYWHEIFYCVDLPIIETAF